MSSKARPAVRAAAVCLLALVLASDSYPQAGGLILDESCYLRRYIRFAPTHFSPALVKSEGDKVLKKADFDKLRKDSEKWMTDHGLDPAKADWRDHVYYPTYKNYTPVPSPVPPDDWTSADFDDSQWVLERRPFQGTPPAAITRAGLGQYDEWMDMGLRTAFYRVRFVVDDPKKATGLTFHAVYSGGVRAFVNGQEIARGHLPKGELSIDIPGEDYPASVYPDTGKASRERTLGPVGVKPQLLRKGVNVLAIEVRASELHPVVQNNPRQGNWGGPTRPFTHGKLIKFDLRGSGVSSALARPAGAQAWAADPNRRVESSDFLPAGEGPESIRIVGAAGGTYSAQVVVGSDKTLTALAVTAGELKADGGASIPASAMTVFTMLPFPLDDWTMKTMGDERGLDATFPDMKKLATLAKMEPASKGWFFDQLTRSASATVAANTSRPTWISLIIPADAKPGTYRGSVTVAAQGMNPATLPTEVEVVDWRMPKSSNFKTVVGCEENPYAVAKQYGVKLWSEEHFKLLDASFAQLGRIGNRWINVPVLVKTEFANGDDSMVKWIHKKDGSYAFDYTILDRYLDVAMKHCGTPRVVQVVVEQGMKSQMTPPTPPMVKVTDQASGRTSLMDVGLSGPNASQARDAWKAFGTAIYDHLKTKGLEKVMYWGAPLEGEAEPELKDVLASCVPQVFWTAGPHEMMSNGTYAKTDRFYKVISTIRYWGNWPAFRMDQGWKSPALHVLNPRVGGTVFALHTTSHPFAYRVLPDRSIAFGRVGFTRLGADEWAAIHYEGMTLPKWLTGMPVLFTLWPGKDGAESSARFECMLEGIQEAEARIFI